MGPLARRPARQASPGPRRALGTGPGRPEALGVPPAPRREVPGRNGFQRRCGDLEPRPVLQADSPQFEPAASGISRARVPIMDTYSKVDDITVAITTKRVASYFPYMVVYLLFTSPNSFEQGGRDWGKAAQCRPPAPAPSGWPSSPHGNRRS